MRFGHCNDTPGAETDSAGGYLADGTTVSTGWITAGSPISDDPLEQTIGGRGFGAKRQEKERHAETGPEEGPDTNEGGPT
jgi:hypothetical protein